MNFDGLPLLDPYLEMSIKNTHTITSMIDDFFSSQNNTKVENADFNFANGGVPEIE